MSWLSSAAMPIPSHTGLALLAVLIGGAQLAFECLDAACFSHCGVSRAGGEYPPTSEVDGAALCARPPRDGSVHVVAGALDARSHLWGMSCSRMARSMRLPYGPITNFGVAAPATSVALPCEWECGIRIGAQERT